MMFEHDRNERESPNLRVERTGEQAARRVRSLQRRIVQAIYRQTESSHPSRGKLKLNLHLAELIESQQRTNSIEILPVALST